MRRLLSQVSAGVLGVALLSTGVAAPAYDVTPQAVAQSSTAGAPGDGLKRAVYDAAAGMMAGWSRNPNAETDLLNIISLFQNFTPWHMVPLWQMWGHQTPYTIDRERDFAAPRLIAREQDAPYNVERLYIESPAMRHVVQVQVQYPADRTAPAPMLYLLDGLSGQIQSGWLRQGKVQTSLADQQVVTIMPTEGGGSNYTDWVQTDPYLGRAKWETFLTQELPLVMEQQTNIPFNGERYLGGLSMGGSAAIRIANLHPELYAGAFSISGCYSSVNTAGREYFNGSARLLGANPDLMWGAGNTPERLRGDVVAHPQGIATLPLYIYTGTGVAEQRDIDFAYPEGISNFAGNVALEKLTHHCTGELAASLQEKGLMNSNITFDYHPTGTHDWQHFGEQLPVAWKNVTKNRYTRQ